MDEGSDGSILPSISRLKSQAGTIFTFRTVKPRMWRKEAGTINEKPKDYYRVFAPGVPQRQPSASKRRMSRAGLSSMKQQGKIGNEKPHEGVTMKPEDILTPDQLAERLQVKRSWVYEKCRRRERYG
jgi:hypothetical protein